MKTTLLEISSKRIDDATQLPNATKSWKTEGSLSEYSHNRGGTTSREIYSPCHSTIQVLRPWVPYLYVSESAQVGRKASGAGRKVFLEISAVDPWNYWRTTLGTIGNQKCPDMCLCVDHICQQSAIRHIRCPDIWTLHAQCCFWSGEVVRVATLVFPAFRIEGFPCSRPEKSLFFFQILATKSISQFSLISNIQVFEK